MLPHVLSWRWRGISVSGGTAGRILKLATARSLSNNLPYLAEGISKPCTGACIFFTEKDTPMQYKGVLYMCTLGCCREIESKEVLYLDSCCSLHTKALFR